MNVLLTGATGFIGGHLLAKAGAAHRFRCVVRPGSKAVLPPSVERVEADLFDETAMRHALEGIDAVIHLAAALRKERPETIHRVNAEATRLLVRLARQQGVRHFVFVSTENALREDLHDAYAVSKREAEKAVREFPGHLILRPCLTYGRGDAHGLGRMVAMAQRLFFRPHFLGLGGKIQPLYVGDMVEYLVRGLGSGISGEFVLAGPAPVTLNEFVDAALRRQGLFRPALPIPRALMRAAAFAGDLAGPGFGWGSAQFDNLYSSRTYDTAKTAEAFGFRPRGVEEGLEAWLGG